MFIAASFAVVSPISAADGFAAGTTGGAVGAVVTVTNGTDFIAQATATGARVIQVQGSLTIGTVSVRSDKTIVGLGTDATLLGRLSISGRSNIIVQNLRITNPGEDGISIRDPGTHHVWVDHVTFYDCGDGSCDISQGADFVTVSWCKFIYPTQLEHKFTMIADGTPSGQGHITLHHNWWSTGSGSRMPASSYARVHIYNNYFDCTGNSYCSNARTDTQFLSESNYYVGVKDPIYKESTGMIRTSGNIYVATTGKPPDAGTDAVFTPPYSYAPDNATDVPALVQAGAGAPGPDTIPIPPKIWDGSSGTSWNTANNWALNEIPRAYDVLVFAGNAGLANNNNLSSANNGRHLSGLAFSNNAGAFVLSGSTINLGGPITDGSEAAQTINLGIDFSFGADHFTPQRTINVSSPAGSLVINGDIAGPPNSFFSSYALTKTGPGALALNGNNSFVATIAINGGLVRFGQATSFGGGSSISINGGGLQWGPGNTFDISARTVTVGAGGATLDTGGGIISLANAIGNNGSGSLTKTGSGALIFQTANRYRGNIIISDGVLVLSGNGSLTNSPQIILQNGAYLDVSPRADAALTLAGGQVLTGVGNVTGNVVVESGAAVSPGLSIGTLGILSGSLTFQPGSTNLMELDSAAGTSDSLTGMSSVTFGGALIVTDVGGELAAGSSFQLFSAESYDGSFDNVVLPPLNNGLVWTNSLSDDGSIAVIAPLNTTPTNITATVAGDALQVEWPPDYEGWRLEIQTNDMSTGIGTNWVEVPDSAGTNRVFVPIDPNFGSVFLRLVYP